MLKYTLQRIQNCFQICAVPSRRGGIRPMRGVSDFPHRRCGESILYIFRTRMTTRFGSYLGHPWTDFSNFFNFKDPFSIIYKFYFSNIFSMSL